MVRHSNIPNGFADGVDDDSDSWQTSRVDDGMILSYSGGQNCGCDIFRFPDVIEIIESEVLDIKKAHWWG